jgi:hypothetical protein
VAKAVAEATGAEGVFPAPVGEAILERLPAEHAAVITAMVRRRASSLLVKDMSPDDTPEASSGSARRLPHDDTLDPRRWLRDHDLVTKPSAAGRELQ